MKKTFILLAASLLCLCAHSQQKTSYIITKGTENFTSAEWTETKDGNETRIDIVTKKVQRTSTTVNSRAETIKWRIVTNDGKNNYTVVREGNVYEINGKVDGNAGVKREIKSNGLPWYQLVNYSAGKINIQQGKSIEYECIRPTNGKLTTMSLSIKETKEFGGHNCKVVKASTSGALKGLWSCLYYIDDKTGQYIGYQAVEGFGSPMTQWAIEE